MLASGALFLAALRFAWPAPAEAQVELTDERTVGDESRTIVTTMRLRVTHDARTDRFVIRLLDAKLVSINGKSEGTPDPSPTLIGAASIMSSMTPTIVVSHDGRYLETRNLDRMTREIWAVAGLSVPPAGLDAFSRLLSDVAAEDWNTWVGAWIGNQPVVGETAGASRTKLAASAAYPSETVGLSTRGVLIDRAREAKVLKRNTPAASERFLEDARYSPLTETLTVELESATMRPLFAERTRSYFAVHGKLKVEGLERRTHRFTWISEGSDPPHIAD